MMLHRIEALHNRQDGTRWCQACGFEHDYGSVYAITDDGPHLIGERCRPNAA